MGEGLEGLPQQLFLAAAEHVADLAVDQQKAALGRHMGDADGGLLEGGAEAFFTVLTRTFALLLLHGEARQAGEFGDQGNVVVSGQLHRAVVDAEGAEHFAAFVFERQGPAGAQVGGQGQVLEGLPVGMILQVFVNDQFAADGGLATGADAGFGVHAVDGVAELTRQAGGGDYVQAVVRAQAHDRYAHVRVERLQAIGDAAEGFRQWAVRE